VPVVGPATPWAALVGEIPVSVPHGALGLLVLVMTDLKRPCGLRGFSSQYWAGGLAVEPKNIAA
jgi:hypothetical protein